MKLSVLYWLNRMHLALGTALCVPAYGGRNRSWHNVHKGFATHGLYRNTPAADVLKNTFHNKNGKEHSVLKTVREFGKETLLFWS